MEKILRTSESFLIAESGANWLEKIIQENGKFIYGYNYKTLKVLIDYNILRHLGSIWAMLDVYKETGNKKLLKTSITSLEYVDSKYIFEINNKTEVIENGYVKLGALGLGALAYIRCYKLGKDKFNIEWMKEISLKLCESIKSMINKKGIFKYYKKVVTTGEITNKVCNFYIGEALLALIKVGDFCEIEEYVTLANKSINAYYQVREKEGHIRDHWMMHTIESSKNKKHFNYATAIVNETIKNSPSKKAGPTAARSESILAYINILIHSGKRDKIKKYIKIVENQLDFQKQSRIDRGLSEGAFKESLFSYIVRNDCCQHNISSFILYYRLNN